MFSFSVIFDPLLKWHAQQFSYAFHIIDTSLDLIIDS